MEVLGLVAAFLTTASFLPQAIKTIRTRDVSGISIWMYVMLLVGVSIWTAYGFHHQLTPVWLGNIITGIFVAIILVIKIQEMRKVKRAMKH